jgi:hypothetical protein
MRYLVLFLLVGAAMGQSRKPIDWTSCQAVTDQFKVQADKFNAEPHDGLKIQLACEYSGDPKRVERPKRYIPLTASEIIHLHELRGQEHAIFTAVTDYEQYLIHSHHIRQRELGDGCYNFIGFVLDDDFITVDPNPMMAEPDMQCDYGDMK